MMRAIGMFFPPVSGPQVNVAPTKDIHDSGATAYAWVGVDSDGNLKSSTNNANPTTSYEVWLDSGSNSEVWVQATLSGSALTSGSNTTGTTRHALTSDKKWGYTTSFLPLIGTVTLDFYDAVTGGNLLDSQAVSLQAETFA